MAAAMDGSEYGLALKLAVGLSVYERDNLDELTLPAFVSGNAHNIRPLPVRRRVFLANTGADAARPCASTDRAHATTARGAHIGCRAGQRARRSLPRHDVREF